MVQINNEKLTKASKQLKKLQKNIDYDTRDYPIDFICQKFSDRDYFIPSYQRNKVWSEHSKVRLIESLLLGYPIPLIFLSENSDGRLEIVDGVQRITTLSSFRNDQLKLKKLDKLTEFDGFTYSTLPLAEQRKFSDRSLRVIVLSDKTDINTRIDLFDRLNTSAEKANDSEIRSGVYSKNKFQIFINNLSDEPIFQEVVHLTPKKINRKQDIEMISRFFAYSNNYKNFKHSVKDFITDYIVRIGSVWNIKTKNTLHKQFFHTFNYANSGFLKNKKGQTPRVRFEAIMCGLNLALQENPKLNISKEQSKELISDQQFIVLTTTDGSNSPKKVKDRIEYVKNWLLKMSDSND